MDSRYPELPPQVRLHRLVARAVELDGGERAQRFLVLPVKRLYGAVSLVVLPAVVLVAEPQKLLVVPVQSLELGDRHEKVASVVPDLVLNVPFFMPRVRVAEGRIEAVVLLEAEEGVAQLALPSLEHLLHDGRHVVEPQPRRHPSQMLEDRLQTLEEAFPVLTLEELEISCVAVGEGNGEILPRAERPVFVEIGASEIHLRLSSFVLQRESGADVGVDLPLLLLHVGGNGPVRAVEIRICPLQPCVHPLRRVPLFAPILDVVFEPLVDPLHVGLQLRPTIPFGLNGRNFVEVVLFYVLSRGLPVDSELRRDGADGASLVEIRFSDIIDAGHCEHPPFPPLKVSG